MLTGVSSLLLQSVLARNIRVVRADVGLSQDELAQRMHAMGLPWVRATVGKVETERRSVSAEELLSLSACLTVPVSALVAHEGLVHLHEGGLALDGRTLEESLSANQPAWPPRTVASMEDWQARYPVDEAVRHAAQRLGRDAGTVTFRAQTLYGRTLTQERDRRVVESGASSDAESRRAARGHVMRVLLAELAEDFEQEDARMAQLVEQAQQRAAKRAKGRKS